MADFNFEEAFANVEKDLTEAQRQALKDSQNDITDFASFEAVKKAIIRTVVEDKSDGQESNSSEIKEEGNQKPSDELSSTSTSRPASDGNGQDAEGTVPAGETKSTEDVIETQQEVSVKSEQDSKRKAFNDVAEQIGGRMEDSLAASYLNMATSRTEFTAQEIAQIQLAVKEAEFKQKYGIDPHTGEPLKDNEGKPLEQKDGKFKLDERSEALLANKDNLDNIILHKMERIASGVDTLEGEKVTKNTEYAIMGVDEKGNPIESFNKEDIEKAKKEGKEIKTMDITDLDATAKNAQIQKNAFDIVYRNSPQYLKSNCSQTFKLAYWKAIGHPQATKLKRDNIAQKRASKMDKIRARQEEINNKRDDLLKKETDLEAQKESLIVGPNDTFWQAVKKRAKERVVIQNKLRLTRIQKGWTRHQQRVVSAKAGLTISFPQKLKTALRRSWLGKTLKVTDRFMNRIDNWAQKQSNRISLFPNRTAKFLKNKLWNPLKNKINEHFVQPTKHLAKDIIYEKGIKPIGSGIKNKVTGMANWVWDNKGKIALTAAVGVASFSTLGVGGLAAGGIALGVGAAVYPGAKAWVSEQKGRLKQKMVVSSRENAEKGKERALESQEKENARREAQKTKAEDVTKNLKPSYTASFAEGRVVYNQNRKAVDELIGDYKKSINPEGNEGKPKDDKESAVQLMQMLTSKDKTKGGLGLEPEQVNDLVAYLNQTQFKGKPLPTYEEAQKASEDTKEQPTQETENKGKTDSGAEQEVKKKPNPMNSLIDNQAEQLGLAIKTYHANIASGRVTEEQAAQNLGSFLSKPKDKDGLGLSPEQAQEMKNYLGYKGVVAGWKKGKTQKEEDIDKSKKEKGKSAVYQEVKKRTGNEI